MSSVAQYSDILPHLTTKCLPKFRLVSFIPKIGVTNS